MSWTVALASSARRDLKKLDRQTAARVVAALERLAETGHGDLKKLTDVEPPEWRLRVGEHRVRLRFAAGERRIEVLRVLPRGKAYG